MLFRVFTVLAVVALVVSTWILDLAGAPAARTESTPNSRNCPATI